MSAASGGPASGLDSIGKSTTGAHDRHKGIDEKGVHKGSNKMGGMPAAAPDAFDWDTFDFGIPDRLSPVDTACPDPCRSLTGQGPSVWRPEPSTNSTLPAPKAQVPPTARASMHLPQTSYGRHQAGQADPREHFSGPPRGTTDGPSLCNSPPAARVPSPQPARRTEPWLKQSHNPQGQDQGPGPPLLHQRVPQSHGTHRTSGARASAPARGGPLPPQDDACNGPSVLPSALRGGFPKEAQAPAGEQETRPCEPSGRSCGMSGAPARGEVRRTSGQGDVCRTSGHGDEYRTGGVGAVCRTSGQRDECRTSGQGAVCHTSGRSHECRPSGDGDLCRTSGHGNESRTSGQGPRSMCQTGPKRPVRQATVFESVPKDNAPHRTAASTPAEGGSSHCWMGNAGAQSPGPVHRRAHGSGYGAPADSSARPDDGHSLGAATTLEDADAEGVAPSARPAAGGRHAPHAELGQAGVLEFVDLTLEEEDQRYDVPAPDPGFGGHWEEGGDWAGDEWMEDAGCDAEFGLGEANDRACAGAEDSSALAGDGGDVGAHEGETHTVDDASRSAASPVESVLVPCATTSGGIMLHRFVPSHAPQIAPTHAPQLCARVLQ